MSKWKNMVEAYMDSLGEKLSRLTSDNDYRDRRLGRLEEDIGRLTVRLKTQNEAIEEIRAAVLIDEASLDTLSDISKRHDKTIELLLVDQIATHKIGLTTKGDLEALKQDLPAHPDIPAPSSVLEGGLQCSMTLTDKAHKGKVKKVALARKIVNHLIRMGSDWSLMREIKGQILGEDEVKKGGGHFSRTVATLFIANLVEFDKWDGIRLTTFGQRQATLVWKDMRDYNALVDRP